MVSNLVSNALDSHAQVFPTLTDAQINRVRPFASLRCVNMGDVLFGADDSDVPFFILLSGSMEIVQPDINGERLVASHAPGEFTGEMTMITGHHSLVCGRMTDAGEVLEMSGNGLRSLVARDGELSEIFMRAFILRRLILINRSQGNAILMGSRYSAKTLRLREFLTRNGHPYVYVDLDVDQTSQALLDRFDVSVSEIPVVICNYRTVLRNPSIQELSDTLDLNCPIDEFQVRDLIIVGAGPAGLAAAVYGASEGLGTIVLDRLNSDRRTATGVVTRWRHADGELRWLEGNLLALIGPDGRASGFRGTHRDITERRAQHERIARLTRVLQMQSGINFGLTAALYGEITFKDGRVQQSNFHDYQPLRMNEAPVIEVEVVKSSERVGGTGEPGTSVVLAAFTNAVYAATGRRLYTHPAKPEQLGVT